MANKTGRGYFKPGQSGNPGGRPRMPNEVRALARAETAASVRVLAEIRDDSQAPKSVRERAAASLLRFAWAAGLPTAQTEAAA